MKRIIILTAFIAGLTALNACGGGSSGTKYAGFNFDAPTALDELNSDYVRVSGSAWSVNGEGDPIKEESPEEDALLTIRGQYALPVSGLRKSQNYQFQLKVYYQADAYTAPSIAESVKGQRLQVTSDEEGPSTIEINADADLALCPALSLSPDASLEEGIWLKLCDVTFVSGYNGSELIEVVQENFNCTGFDADGDAMANLDEIAETVNPYEGDYDGDCSADGSDAFPDDPDEWLDTDGDGVGNNADTDKDGDGLSNSGEESIGTDPLDSDSDDDTVVDGFDNCPLDGSSSAQTDTDDDGKGDLCDDDSDNDGLSDADESARGTDPTDADTDDDGDSDGTEVSAATNPLDADSDNDGALDGPDVFPLDSTETTDTDSDGVGDNADLCDTVADSTNANTDGDTEGDVCDSDDDNDGISDKTESWIGSNPLSADTDGDGLTDWFGGTLDSLDDPCLLSASDAGADSDGDGFGDTCDLSDDPLVDPSAAEINFAAIFVDPATGNDSNSGSISTPVKTLKQALSLADTDNRPVYATGDFTLSATLDLADGVTIYGGFASGFNGRTPGDSAISSSSLATLVEAAGTTGGAGLDGFTVRNERDDSTAVGILVSDGSFTLKNSTIELGNANHIQALKVFNSEVTIEDNTFALSDFGSSAMGTSNAYGIYLSGSTGTVSQNSVTIADYAQRFAVYCASAGDTDIAVSDNSLDVLESGVDTADSGFIYVTGCYGGSHDSLDAAIDGADFQGLDISGSVLDGLF